MRTSSIHSKITMDVILLPNGNRIEVECSLLFRYDPKLRRSFFRVRPPVRSTYLTSCGRGPIPPGFPSPGDGMA